MKPRGKFLSWRTPGTPKGPLWAGTCVSCLSSPSRGRDRDRPGLALKDLADGESLRGRSADSWVILGGNLNQRPPSRDLKAKPLKPSTACPNEILRYTERKDKAASQNERSKRLPGAVNLLSFTRNKLDSRAWGREDRLSQTLSSEDQKSTKLKKKKCSHVLEKAN